MTIGTIRHMHWTQTLSSMPNLQITHNPPSAIKAVHRSPVSAVCGGRDVGVDVVGFMAMVK